MTQMTLDEKQAFLADLHVGVIALNDPGKGPLTVPIWYDYTPGGDLWVITGAHSRKGKLMEKGTRLSLAAQTETAPYKYVSIEGVVTAVEPTDSATLLNMAKRYLGDVQGQAYAEGSDLSGQVTVRIHCDRWLAVDYSRS